MNRQHCIGWSPAEAEEFMGTRLRTLAGVFDVQKGVVGVAKGLCYDALTALPLLYVEFHGIGGYGFCRDHFESNLEIVSTGDMP